MVSVHTTKISVLFFMITAVVISTGRFLKNFVSPDLTYEVKNLKYFTLRLNSILFALEWTDGQ